MKKIFLIFAILIPIFLIGCDGDNTPQTPWQDKMFAGNHELLALNSFVSTKTTSSSGGGFFVVFGSYGSASETTQNKSVTFSFKNYKNEFMTAEFPIEMVRLQIDSTIDKPYCKFRWSTNDLNEYNWKSSVIYVVVVVRPEQVLGKIQLNLSR